MARTSTGLARAARRAAARLARSPVARRIADVWTQPTDLLYPLDLLGRRPRTSLRGALREKVVLVTGASSGIGAATARRLGAAGGEVVLVARRTDALEEVAADVRATGGTAHVHTCDLSDLGAVSKLTAELLADHGRVDILVNNAGHSIRRPLAESYDRIHDLQRTMQLNYFGAGQLLLDLLPGMRERGDGHVVNVSSAGAQTRFGRFGPYVASKAALDALCDAWQAETLGDGVHFTTIHMTLVRTPMIEATPLYQRLPSLSADDAAELVARAIVHRPRRLSPAFGLALAHLDALSPRLVDRLRHAVFQRFD